MADWGLYSALRGTDNWEQRRSDKAMNLQIIEKQNKNAQIAQQQSMEAEESINKYFDDLANMDVLPEDQERVQALEKSERAKVIAGIGASNGDLKRYLSSGGISDMHSYKNAVQGSEEVKQAMSNKASLKNYLDSSAKGDFIFKVDVDVPKMQDDGNGNMVQVLDEQGQPVMETQNMSFQEQMKKFRAGEISKLNFNGSEKEVKLDAFSFSKQPKNKLNPYSKDNIVMTSDIEHEARQKGASPKYAKAIADEYAAMVRAGGDSWKWGNLSEEERLMEEAKRNKLNGSGSGSGSSKTTQLNTIAPAYKRLKDGGSHEMGPGEVKFWDGVYGMNYDAKTNTTKPRFGMVGLDTYIGSNGKRAEYDLSNAVSVENTGEVVSKNNAQGVPERYIVMDIIYDADNPSAKNPHYEDWTQGNDRRDDATKNNWVFENADVFGILPEDGGADMVKGQVLVPIESKINQPTFVDQINSSIKTYSTQEGHAASVNSEMIQQDIQRTFNDLKTKYGSEYNDQEILEATYNQLNITR